MDGDGGHDGPEIARQVRGGDRRQHGAETGRVLRLQYGAPLQVSCFRARDLVAFRRRVRLRPCAPRLVWRRRVAGPCVDLHLARLRRRPPADRSPRRDGARVADVGVVRAFLGAFRRKREQLARVARRADSPPGAVAQQRGHLARGRPRDERRARRIAGDPKQFSLRPGADEERTVLFDQEIVRQVVVRLPRGIPQAVGAHAVNDAFRGAPRLADDRLRRAGADRGVADGDCGNLRRNRRHATLRRFRRRASFRARPVLAAARRPAERRGVNGPVIGEPHRVQFLERGVEQHERLPLRIEPEEPAGGFRPREQIAGLLERKRHDVGRVRFVEDAALALGPDLVDDAFVAGRRVDVAFAIDRERPDVFVAGIEERLRRAVGRDLVDLAVRRGTDVEAAVRRGRKGVDLELGRVEEHRDLAVARDLEDLPLVAGARPQRAVRSGNDRPQKRRRGLRHLGRRRTEEKTSVAVDGEILDFSLEKIGLGRDGPERWRGAREHQRRGAREKHRDGAAKRRAAAGTAPRRTGDCHHGIEGIRTDGSRLRS